MLQDAEHVPVPIDAADSDSAGAIAQVQEGVFACVARSLQTGTLLTLSPQEILACTLNVSPEVVGWWGGRAAAHTLAHMLS